MVGLGLRLAPLCPINSVIQRTHALLVGLWAWTVPLIWAWAVPLVWAWQQQPTDFSYVHERPVRYI